MKIIFNTRRPNSPASIFYKAGFSLSEAFQFGSKIDYRKAQVALFMGFADDFELIRQAKAENPDLWIGVIDPRNDEIQAVAEHIDFFILDSLEMMDYFGKYQKPIFQYFEYPLFQPSKKQHQTKTDITIGYHGNKVHLMTMWEHVSPALTALAQDLGKDYRLVFKPIYNIEQLGIWNLGEPENIKIQHTQLDDSTFPQEIQACDIGLVPAFLPLASGQKERKSSFFFRKIFLHSEEDYLFRFKMPTNLGRLIVFARLGVPVISDMFPSACQFVSHGQDGFLVANSESWYVAMRSLIESAPLRQKFSDNFYEKIHNLADYRIQNKNLLQFLEELQKKPRSQKSALFLGKKYYSCLQLMTYYVHLYWNKLKKKLS